MKDEVRSLSQLLPLWDNASRDEPLIILDWGDSDTSRKHSVTQHEASILFSYIGRSNRLSDKSALQIVQDIADYTCPVTDKPITSRMAHRENLKRTGCRLLEPGEKRESAKRQRDHAEEKLTRSVSAAIASIAHEF